MALLLVLLLLLLLDGTCDICPEGRRRGVLEE
jgi:hypothetical protein